MSYILDAIKKSDREYQLQQGLGAAQFHYTPGAAKPARSPLLWLSGLCALLLLLLLSVAYYLVDSGLMSLRLPALTLPEQPSVALKADAERVAAPVPSAPVAAGQAVPPGQPGAAPSLARAEPQTALALMPMALRHRLGPFHFSLHVYSAQPEQRSIIINNRMMHEGEWLTPQLQLHAITQEGVIMSAEGAYYRVPVVNDWQ